MNSVTLNGVRQVYHVMSFQDEVRATFRRGDSDAVLRMAEAERQRAHAAGEPGGEVEAIYAMARVALRGGDLSRAEELAELALGVAVRSGDRRLEERPRHVLAAVSRLSGDYRTARPTATTSGPRAWSVSPTAPTAPSRRCPTPTTPPIWPRSGPPRSPRWGRAVTPRSTRPAQPSAPRRRSA